MEITLDYSHGLNTDADHMTCPNGQLIRLSEFYIDYKTIKSRFGTALVNSAALAGVNNIDHVVAWQDPAQIQTATRYVVLALSNNKAFTGTWQSDANVEAGSTVSFNDVTNSVAVGKFPCTSDVLNGKLVICTNSQPPVALSTYNGNIAALGGSPPTGVCVKTVNNMMFIAGTFFTGTTGILSRVYWSAVGDPTTWPAASNLDFRVNDGDFIIALGSLGQNLVIFKNNSIGLLQTTSQTVSGTVTLGPLTTLFTGIGCCSPCAIDNLPDGRLVFLGSDLCLYITDGTNLINVSKRPYPQSSVFSGISGIWTGTQGTTGFPVIKVYPTRHEIWIVPGASTAGQSAQAYVYDYFQDTWSYTANFGIQCMALLSPVRNAPTAGYPYRMIYGESIGTSNIRLLESTTGGTVTSGTIEFTIPLVKELASYIPRSVVIPFTGGGNQASVNFGFNGTYDSNYTYSLSSSVFRNVLPVKYPYGTNSVRPISFQIKISNAIGSSPKIYPITISDQVLS